MTQPNEEKSMRERWHEFWDKTSLYCEQRYLTPDTHGIILEFIHSENQRLLEKIEGEIGGMGAFELDADMEDLLRKKDTLDIIRKYKKV